MTGTIRVVVISLLCFLSFASSAAAECAWVLWEDTIEPKGKPTTEPVRAYKTKPDCDQGLAEALASFTGPTVVSKDTKRQEAFVMMGKEVVGYRYVCIPDTIDPRGPKGK